MRLGKTILWMFVLALIAVFSQPALAGDVAKGKMISMDDAAKTVTVENEIDKKPMVFDLTTAKIGAKPDKGHVLLIAYKKEGDKNVAIKVMNVTRQSLRKG